MPPRTSTQGKPGRACAVTASGPPSCRDREVVEAIDHTRALSAAQQQQPGEHRGRGAVGVDDEVGAGQHPDDHAHP
jgi:hypothetical protein